ncbi:GIY-YIG nuclease family protein [Tumidithrix helvetica PCC 7403]|uniref:GIY-YIG nuclease family protein n=1 Tax=Tumidithrix helvetica TaxID=3457545 RepID=UPI003C9447A4
MKIFLLPSKSIHKLHELPTEAGVYYVTAFWLVFYVGQAKNLRNRWRKNHQRYNQFKLLAPFGRLHYKTMPASQIATYEKAEIKYYKPVWNYSRVPDFFGLLTLFLGVWLRVIVYTLMMLALVAIAIYLIWFL